MTGHKFKVGRLVYYLNREGASGVYQVTQLLPPEGETFQLSHQERQRAPRAHGQGA